MGAIIIAHGGVGGSEHNTPLVEAAVAAGRAVLEAGGKALQAALVVVRTMEDAEAFNAGTGSYLRIDGQTIEMDASVMTDEGRAGAVAAVRGVRHPIDLAAALLDGPHIMLTGRGAEGFAERLGMETVDHGTDKARAAYAKVRERLARADTPAHTPAWSGWGADYSGLPLDEGTDTVGACVRDSAGRMVTACSTGGTSLMMVGRVGDSPIIGAGVYASRIGAVGATGIGEHIISRVSSKAIIDRMATGMDVEAACATELATYPQEVPIGFIAVSPTSHASVANRPMALAVYQED